MCNCSLKESQARSWNEAWKSDQELHNWKRVARLHWIRDILFCSNYTVPWSPCKARNETKVKLGGCDRPVVIGHRGMKTRLTNSMVGAKMYLGTVRTIPPAGNGWLERMQSRHSTQRDFEEKRFIFTQSFLAPKNLGASYIEVGESTHVSSLRLLNLVWNFL